MDAPVNPFEPLGPASLFHQSSGRGPKLRIALLLSGTPPPVCARGILAHLRACDYIHVAATIHVPAAPAGFRGSTLYRAYRRLDAWIYPEMARALAPHACDAQLRGVASYAVDCDPTRRIIILSALERSILDSCRIDVILALGRVPDPAALAEVAKYGVWRCRLGDCLLGDDQPRIFENMVRSATPFGVWLEALSTDWAAPRILARSGTAPLTVTSVLCNLPGPAYLAEMLMLSRLWQLHSAGWKRVVSQGDEDVAGHPAGDAVQGPATSNARMLSWGAARAVHLTRRRLRQRHTVGGWRVGLRHGSESNGIAAACRATDYAWITAPPHHYYADPFLFSRSSQSWLFVEDFDLQAGRGSICCMRIDERGLTQPAQEVMQRPYHLSYPQVFEQDGEIFMIPETGANNTVELYRAVDFPIRWELVRVMFRGPAFDTTLLRHDGRFWFFVTLIDGRSSHGTLVLFHSSSLLGDWTLHPSAPISSDVRTARCAGAPFLDNGDWIRPAQDGSRTYGGAVHFRRIVRLDATAYCELPDGTLTADNIEDSRGVHTYNRCGSLEAIDSKVRFPLPARLRPRNGAASP